MDLQPWKGYGKSLKHKTKHIDMYYKTCIDAAVVNMANSHILKSYPVSSFVISPC